MQIDAAHQALAAHRQQGDLGGVRGQSPLHHLAQIGLPDPVGFLRQTRDAPVVLGGDAQQFLALSQTVFRVERRFDLAERLQREARIVGDGFALLGATQAHIPAEASPRVQRHDGGGAGAGGRALEALLDVDRFARYVPVSRRQRQRGPERGLGLADPVEGGGDAPLRRYHVRPAIKRVEGHARRNAGGEGRELCSRRDRGGRIASDQDFQGAQGAAMREPHPLRGVTVGRVARAGRHDVRLGSYADAEPIVAQADQALRIGRHLVRQLHLLRGFRRDEPGARDRCGQGLPGEAVVGVAGVTLGDGGVALVA
ncbi:hypothetical protein D3C72_1092720 [compost metagenome]